MIAGTVHVSACVCVHQMKLCWLSHASSLSLVRAPTSHNITSQTTKKLLHWKWVYSWDCNTTRYLWLHEVTNRQIHAQNKSGSLTISLFSQGSSLAFFNFFPLCFSAVLCSFCAFLRNYIVIATTAIAGWLSGALLCWTGICVGTCPCVNLNVCTFTLCCYMYPVSAFSSWWLWFFQIWADCG